MEVRQCFVLGVMLFSPTQNKRLWIPSRLIKIRLDWKRLPEYLGYRLGGGSQKKATGQVTCNLIP